MVDYDHESVGLLYETELPVSGPQTKKEEVMGRHPWDWLGHFILMFAVSFLLGVKGAVICGVTIELTQIEAAWMEGNINQIDVGDTIVDLSADGLGIWAGRSFRKLLLGEK